MKKLAVMKAVFAAALLCMAASRSHAEVIWVRYASATKVSLYGSYAYTQFNVNLGVWPVTAGHRVGVVSTTDGWRTVKWTDARWQCNLPNAYGSWDEQWNALENLAAPQAAQVWYAVYVDDQAGNRTWNNNNGWNFAAIVR